MTLGSINNKNLFTEDMAITDRQAALRKISRRFSSQRKVELTSSGWMEDVSGRDSRSVKAQLKGRNSYRVLWWKVFSSFHCALSESGSLEHAMFDFHRLHHALTLFFMKTEHEYRNLVNAIHKKGLCKAIKQYIADTKISLRPE